MSLQLAAKHVASKGRGTDSTLVHMSPREVDSLQAIAKAHGGSLSVNPQTGLPEAGFLESLLPSIAGAALSAIPGVGPLMAAGIVGGGTALLSGNLRKGMMAGLGAYGGAGIGGNVANAGANAAASELAGAGQAAASKLGEGANALDILRARSANAGPAMSALSAAPNPSVELAKQGLKSIADRPSLLFNRSNLKYGLAAMAPALMAEQKQEEYDAESQKNPYEYTFNMRPTGIRPTGEDREMRFFDPVYTRMAEGGVTNMAEGGDTDPPNPYSYTYDPVLQRYTETSGERKSIADPAGSAGAAGRAAAKPESGYSAPMSDKTNSYLDWEANTEEGRAARDARMTEVGKGLSMLNPYNSVMSLANMVQGKPAFDFPDMGVVFGTPEAYRTYEAARTMPAGVPYGLDVPSAPAGGAATAVPAGVSIEQSPYGGGGNYAGYTTGSGEGGGRDTQGSTGGGLGGVGGEGTEGANGPGDGTAADYAAGGLSALARGGMSHLGDYSDGGRLLRGPGDGVSDSIPATIADKRPARLADGEFVVPARIVSELGNGSTEAGARKLYAMMDRVQKNRRKTVGKGKVAVNSRSDKYLPA